jgi:hypothetical protein
MAQPGLIDLQTDLKSLRYGSDKPYITKDINNPPSSNGIGMQISKRIDDTSRIAQMLVDKPGLKFIGNQALLQQTDTVEKLQKASSNGLKSGIKEGLQIAKNTALQTAKIIGSTLAQVPVNGTGTHFVHGFRTDTYLQPAGGNTRSAFAQFFGAGGIEGAPLALRGEKIEGVVESNFATGDIQQYLIQSKSYSESQNYITSKLQPGQADTTFLPQTIEGSINHQEVSEFSAYPTGSVRKVQGEVETTLEPGTILKQPEKDRYKEGKTYYTEQQNRKIGGSTKDIVKETRINLGDQGARNDDAKRQNKYTVVTGNRLEVDKLNALDIQNSRPDGIDEARDLAKFYFEIITPEESKFINFRAFITTLDDSYNANWESKKYVGRADEFYTYGGFSRDINISFTIAAATRSEMQPLYRKMVYLASTTAPTYGEYKFMRGTVVRLSLGSYFNQIPGVLTSVKYSWQKDYPWEIAIGSPEGAESGVQELPMVLDCSISFKPIHDFVPQTGLQHYFTSKEGGKSFW